MARKKRKRKKTIPAVEVLYLSDAKITTTKKMLCPYWKTYSGYHGNNNEICELHSAVQQMSTT